MREELITESRPGPKTGSMVFKNVVGTMSQGLDERRILLTVFKRICREIGAKSDSKCCILWSDFAPNSLQILSKTDLQGGFTKCCRGKNRQRKMRPYTIDLANEKKTGIVHSQQERRHK